MKNDTKGPRGPKKGLKRLQRKIRPYYFVIAALAMGLVIGLLIIKFAVY